MSIDNSTDADKESQELEETPKHAAVKYRCRSPASRRTFKRVLILCFPRYGLVPGDYSLVESASTHAYSQGGWEGLIHDALLKELRYSQPATIA